MLYEHFMKFKSQNTAFQNCSQNILELIPMEYSSLDLYGLCLYHLVYGSDTKAYQLIDDLYLEDLEYLKKIQKSKRHLYISKEDKESLKKIAELVNKKPDLINPNLWKEANWGGISPPKVQSISKINEDSFEIELKDDSNRLSALMSIREKYQIEDYIIITKDSKNLCCTVISNTKKDPVFFKADDLTELEEIYASLIQP